MIIHTIEQVNELRGFAEANGTKMSYQIGEIPPVEFYVADFGSNRPFELAVAAAFTDIGVEQDGVIIVDESVPEQLQGPWALHELLDFTQSGHEHPNRCVSSDAKILAGLDKVDPELAQYYAEKRQELYTSLGAFAQTEASFSTIDIEWFEKLAVDLKGEVLTHITPSL
jgi:hypothetical protein